MVKRGTPRRGGANAATRAAILGSARQAFARAGYDGVGVREIAEGAGVTAMLVNRYFGSKEQLFAEVIADIMATPIILTPHTLASSTAGDDRRRARQADDGRRAAARRLQHHAPLGLESRAAEIGREQIEAHYHKRLAAALRGPHASQRAALVLAVVAGIQVMRQMIGLSALADCPPAVLVKILAPVFQQLMGDRAPRRTPKSEPK